MEEQSLNYDENSKKKKKKKRKEKEKEKENGGKDINEKSIGYFKESWRPEGT